MTNRFCVTATQASDDPDRATVAWVIANAALASGKDTMVFLSSEGVRVGFVGGADAIHQEGFAALSDLIETFGSNGGRILVCTPCVKVGGLILQSWSPGRSSAAERDWWSSSPPRAP